METAVGEFVGTVRQEYEQIIKDVINKCTTKENFMYEQTKELINYAEKKYGDEPEFLWEKFDDDAILRNKENNKWYAVLMTVSAEKININSKEKIEIVDLMYQKDKIEDIIDGVKVFPGYHMNKKSWITVVLNNSMDNKSLFELLDNSYNLSIRRK